MPPAAGRFKFECRTGKIDQLARSTRLMQISTIAVSDLNAPDKQYAGVQRCNSATFSVPLPRVKPLDRDCGQPEAAPTTCGGSSAAQHSSCRCLTAGLPRPVEWEEWENPEIPSGYTYLAQLVAHDCVFTSVPTGAPSAAPGPATSKRSSLLRLETIYGHGPDACPHAYVPRRQQSREKQACVERAGNAAYAEGKLSIPGYWSHRRGKRRLANNCSLDLRLKFQIPAMTFMRHSHR